MRVNDFERVLGAYTLLFAVVHQLRCIIRMIASGWRKVHFGFSRSLVVNSINSRLEEQGRVLAITAVAALKNGKLVCVWIGVLAYLRR